MGIVTSYTNVIVEYNHNTGVLGIKNGEGEQLALFYVQEED